MKPRELVSFRECSTERKAAVVAAYRAGVKSYTILLDHKISRRTYELILCEAKVKRRPAYGFEMKRKVDREKLQEMWNSGIKAEAIAAELGVNRSTVSYIVNELGLPRRETPIGVSTFGYDYKVLADAYANKALTLKQITEKFGAHACTIRAAARKYGVPPRTPHDRAYRGAYASDALDAGA